MDKITYSHLACKVIIKELNNKNIITTKEATKLFKKYCTENNIHGGYNSVIQRALNTLICRRYLAKKFIGVYIKNK